MNIRDLYRKVAEFERELSSSTRSLLNCRNQCAQCCKVDLSIFEVEAASIRDWVMAQSDAKRSEWEKQWADPPQDGFCVFLRNHSCTIYDARPLICRSQGLALQFEWMGDQHVDICPLNESALEGMPAKEILNLDRVNFILAQIEQLDSKGVERPRKTLRSLQRELQDLI